MKVFIVYDSFFGNTEVIAKNIQTEFERNGDDTFICQVKGVKEASLRDVDLIVIGSPTRAFKPTRAIVDFIKKLDKAIISRSKFAVFDTRMDIITVDNKLLTVMTKSFGYANDTMVKLIKKQGGSVLA